MLDVESIFSNAYVDRKEFRDIRSAEPRFVNTFLDEWKKYADSLSSQKMVGY